MRNGRKRASDREVFLGPLKQALNSALKAKRDKEQVFIKEWYHYEGDVTYFLFRKNLSATNIQFAELFSLVRAHLKVKNSGRVFNGIQILSLEDFSSGMSRILSLHNSAKEIITLYGETLQRTVLAEPLYGSCIIFVPPHLMLPHNLLCADSGYIHSCGTDIYTAPINRANLEDLCSSLESYLGTLGSLADKILFRPYSHEDFTPTDRELASELKNGLDDVKIHLEKYQLGDIPLVEALSHLKRQFGSTLDFSPLKDNNRQPGGAPCTETEPKEQLNTRTQTVWLLMDRRIDLNTNGPSSERCLICYAQQYKNESAFALFEENKPAWISHTTLPHSLGAAMINITRPWPSGPGLMKAHDPFAGSGTTLLESLRFNRLVLTGADSDWAARLISRDNLNFFAKSSRELKNLRSYLVELVEVTQSLQVLPDPTSEEEKVKPRPLNRYEKSLKLYRQIFGAEDERIKDIPKTHELSLSQGLKFEERVLFYLHLRVRYRHAAELYRGKDVRHHYGLWSKAYIREALSLVKQLDRFITLRLLQEKSGRQLSERQEWFLGEYSQYIGISAHFLRDFRKRRLVSKRIAEGNALKPFPKKYDIIITDPPYGFNTSESPKKLSQLYSRMISNCVKSIKDGGHLVICLPEMSYTGRRLPEITHRSLVTYQILTSADLHGKEIFSHGCLLPKPRQLFSAPYYWESERALRRTILHFQFRICKKPHLE